MENFNFSFLKSPSTWSEVVLILSGVFTTLNAQYPNVVWIGTAVAILSFISANYFKKQEVLGAAQSSLSAHQPVSGQ